MLTREGYLICKPRSGYYIAPIVESEQAEIREARFAIESAAIRLIMRKRGKSSADELLATVRLSQTEDEHYARKNYYFHSKLGELTGNEQLRRIITDLVAKSLIPPDQIETGPDGSRRNYHTLICEAMADLDVDAAIYHLRCDILGEDFSYLV
jgi:DNA-binding GntR family transcriptional regulator